MKKKIKAILSLSFIAALAISPPAAFAEESAKPLFAATETASHNGVPALLGGILFIGGAFILENKRKDQAATCVQPRFAYFPGIAGNPGTTTTYCAEYGGDKERQYAIAAIASGVVGIGLSVYAFSEFSKDSAFADYLEGFSLREKDGGVMLQKSWQL